MSVALLREYRNKSVRSPYDVLAKGRHLLETKSPKSFGDDLWPLLEQVYVAALDMGDFTLAGQCYEQLDARFPNSPRVEMLQGMRLEAEGDLDTARRLYEDMLSADESNVIVWKRLVAVYKQAGQIPRAIDSLTLLLDTFYNDLDGWLELASIYASIFQYEHAMQSLSHALLLAPQNPFYALQFAETAYTAGDIPLALKMFLRVTEQVDDEEVQHGGVLTRAWMGVKQCIRRIQYSRHITLASNTPVPEHANLLDVLATERLLNAYGDKLASSAGKREVVKWLEARA
ncbi:TPR-like protein [Calocera cornea HHB12733]|uniref:ER membrane protein complex subunit 2 n=1 Tax=Calocera cornea HHB12733 TaxID=1353952 RepID=A0A165EJD5_9BASI|nr:TPR-like protein [Calocera cornea HHB12733]